MTPLITPKNKAPRIVAKTEVFTNEWLNVTKKSVEMGWKEGVDEYYSVRVADYIAIYAVTPSGKIAIVKQYRPALERFTHELPAGTVEKEETPDATCRRELKEETGLDCRRIFDLGTFFPDSGRLEEMAVRVRHELVNPFSGAVE